MKQILFPRGFICGATSSVNAGIFFRLSELTYFQLSLVSLALIDSIYSTESEFLAPSLFIQLTDSLFFDDNQKASCAENSELDQN